MRRLEVLGLEQNNGPHTLSYPAVNNERGREFVVERVLLKALRLD